MGGFFGCASVKDCTHDVFYGTDYHSHLGTKRGGMAVRNKEGIRKKSRTLRIVIFAQNWSLKFRTSTEDKGSASSVTRIPSP